MLGFLHFHDISMLRGCSSRVGEKVGFVLRSKQQDLTHDAAHDGPGGIWMRRLFDARVNIRNMNMVRVPRFYRTGKDCSVTAHRGPFVISSQLLRSERTLSLCGRMRNGCGEGEICLRFGKEGDEKTVRHVYSSCVLGQIFSVEGGLKGKHLTNHWRCSPA